MKGEEGPLTNFMKGNWGTCMNSIHASVPEWIFLEGGGAEMCFS